MDDLRAIGSARFGIPELPRLFDILGQPLFKSKEIRATRMILLHQIPKSL